MITYRKASFRGVEFEVTDRTWSSGRRTQVHEYPNKDIPYTEDLGKKAGNYPITAFVIGEDYISKRDALIKACIEKGPGTLIHPDYGTLDVICDGISVKESSTQKGMAVVDLVFLEAGEKAIPESSVDMSESVLNASNVASQSAMDSFLSSFSLSAGVAGLTSLIGGISGVCTSQLNNIGTGIGYADGLTSDIKGATNTLVDAGSLAMSLKTDVTSLLNTPSSLTSKLDNVFSSITSLAGNKSSSFQTVRSLKSTTTASEKASNSNTDAVAEKICMQQIEQLTNQLIVAKEAEIITKIEFENADEAESILADFVDDEEEIELYEDIEPSTEVIQNMRTLREAVTEYIRVIILELPKTKTINLPERMPSLVLAYDLYEDLSRADEIEKKNKIPFPGFVPGGKDLKVLTE